jgi:hypothetical protein
MDLADLHRKLAALEKVAQAALDYRIALTSGWDADTALPGFSLDIALEEAGYRRSESP